MAWARAAGRREGQVQERADVAGAQVADTVSTGQSDGVNGDRVSGELSGAPVRISQPGETRAIGYDPAKIGGSMMRKLLALAMLAGSLLVAVLLPAPALAQAQVVEPCCATILEGYRRSSWNASPASAMQPAESSAEPMVWGTRRTDGVRNRPPLPELAVGSARCD